jgi:hypothetical protein
MIEVFVKPAANYGNSVKRYPLITSSYHGEKLPAIGRMDEGANVLSVATTYLSEQNFKKKKFNRGDLSRAEPRGTRKRHGFLAPSEIEGLSRAESRGSQELFLG